MKLGSTRLFLFVIAITCLVSVTGCTKPAREQAIGGTASQQATSLPSVRMPLADPVKTPKLPAMPQPPSVSASTDIDDGEETTVRDLNGETKDCEVFSYKSGETYTLDVDFEGDEARINFPNGGYKYVDIDAPDGTEFISIAATDHEGESWEITVSDPPQASDSDDSDDTEDSSSDDL